MPASVGLRKEAKGERGMTSNAPYRAGGQYM